MSSAVDCVHHAVGVLRMKHCPEAANRLLIEVVPTLDRLAASLAECRNHLPANAPERLEAEAALRLFREGV